MIKLIFCVIISLLENSKFGYVEDLKKYKEIDEELKVLFDELLNEEEKLIFNNDLKGQIKESIKLSFIINSSIDYIYKARSKIKSNLHLLLEFDKILKGR